jgi:flagellin
MSLTLNTNISSLNTQNWLTTNSATLSKATQELSSGYQINSAADDPAGYAIAFKLGTKSAVLQTAINNANQGTSMLQVAQGAMQQVGNILTQLKQIATEAASANDGDTNSLQSLDSQRQALETQITHINASTTYNGAAIFGQGNVASGTALSAAGYVSNDVSGWTGAAAGTYNITSSGAGLLTLTDSHNNAQTVAFTTPTGINTTTLNFSSFGIKLTVNSNGVDLAGTALTVTPGAANLVFQTGDADNSFNQVSLTLSNVDAATLGLSATPFTSSGGAATYMTTVGTAITNLNNAESAVGNAQDQLGYQTANLQTMQTNTQAAESSIKDTNYASAMSTFTQAQIATQADVAMLSQANSIPQQIIALIKGQ